MNYLNRMHAYHMVTLLLPLISAELEPILARELLKLPADEKVLAIDHQSEATNESNRLSRFFLLTSKKIRLLSAEPTDSMNDNIRLKIVGEVDMIHTLSSADVLKFKSIGINDPVVMLCTKSQCNTWNGRDSKISEFDLKYPNLNPNQAISIESVPDSKWNSVIFMSGVQKENKNEFPSFITRSLPDGTTTQDTTDHLDSNDYVRNVGSFSSGTNVYFLKIATENFKDRTPSTQNIFWISRICGRDPTDILRTTLYIRLDIPLPGEVKRIPIISSFDESAEQLIILVGNDTNSVIPGGGLYSFDLKALDRKFTEMWTNCQKTAGPCSKSERYENPGCPFSRSIPRAREYRCRPYNNGTAEEICQMRNFARVIKPYTHLDLEEKFPAKFSTVIQSDDDIISLFPIRDTVTGDSLFLVTKKGSLREVPIGKASGEEVRRFMPKLGDDLSSSRVAFSPLGFILSAVDSSVRGVTFNCQGLFPQKSCSKALAAVKEGHGLCGWCSALNGLGSHVSESCQQGEARLEKSCPPEINSSHLIENGTALLITGYHLNTLNGTRILDCREKECRIDHIEETKIRCTLQSKDFGGKNCSPRLAGYLEGWKFEIPLQVPATEANKSAPKAVPGSQKWFVGIIAIVAGVLAIGVAYFIYSRRWRQRKMQEDRTSSILPLPLRSDPHYGGFGRPGNRYRPHPNQDAPDLEFNTPPPYEDMGFLVPENLRLPLDKLNIACEIGSGHFGIVYKAQYTNPQNTTVPVAVKTLHSGVRGAREFLQEGIRMENFDHDRVLSLVGISFTEHNYPVIVTPYMPRGDLLTYLRDPNNAPDVRRLLNFCVQIAEGMQYLHKLKFIHRDLAARNCMLDESLNVKIADFGLCRDVYESESYVPLHRDRDLPLRWMALEGIEFQEYTFKGDVWAYGVVMWENMTRGRVPYAEVSGFQLLSFLKNGNRLAQPPHCPDSL